MPVHERPVLIPADLLRDENLSPDEIFAGQGANRLENVKSRIAERACKHLAAARKLAAPHKALAAFLPAALVPLMLRARHRELPLYRRQMALLRASLTGRI